MKKRVETIGVPCHFGCGEIGVRKGPQALRELKTIELLESKEVNGDYVFHDAGDIEVNLPHLEIGNPLLRYESDVLDVCTILKEKTYRTIKEGMIPLIIGGDHSISMGSIAGVSAYYQEKKQKIGVIWFDAHGDINTPETTKTGNLHGMPLAHLLGIGSESFKSLNFEGKFSVLPENLVLIGTRDLDPAEVKILNDHKVKFFSMDDVIHLGMSEVMRQALEIVNNGTIGFHVSFDLDCIDPENAPGVSTAVSLGVKPSDALIALNLVKETNKLLSFELVELNPDFDIDNKSALLAQKLIMNVF